MPVMLFECVRELAAPRCPGRAVGSVLMLGDERALRLNVNSAFRGVLGSSNSTYVPIVKTEFDVGFLIN
jgi:hypothetical protein